METKSEQPVRPQRILLFRWVFWFMLANGLVLMLVACRYLKFIPSPEEALGRWFLVISYFGHFLSLALYPFPVAALAVLLFPRRRPVFFLTIALAACLVFGVLIDTFVFAQYRFHMNGMVWKLLTSGAAGEVLPLTRKVWSILLGAAGLVVAAESLLARYCWGWVVMERRRLGGMTLALVLGAVFSTHLIHAWASANDVSSVTSLVRYFPAFQPLTMRNVLTKAGLAREAHAASSPVPRGGTALRYPLEGLTFRGAQGKPLNLMVIVVESWRWDHLTPEITPNIWRFSERSSRFENHFSSGNCTRFGIFGLLYGLYGTYWHQVLAEERSPVLMRELERRRYRMGVFASAPLIDPEFNRTVFADIRNQIAMRTPGANGCERDRAITERMVDFLSKAPADQPFFGFLFYDSPHNYEHPPGVNRFQSKSSSASVNYFTLNNDTDPLPLLNAYRNSLYNVDDLVSEVLAELEKRHFLENTVVVITGDHGQEFNDLKLNYWGHCGNFSRYQTQTPMIVSWPGKRHQVYNQVTSHVDLAPTLMQDLLGCKTEASRYSNGRNLYDTSGRPFALISSWDTFSINERDRITVSEAYGFQVLSSDYRPIKGAQLRTEVSREAMEGIGRFFAR